MELGHSIGTVTIFSIFIVGALFSRSLAGSISKREMVVLLSYPVKRWSVLLSKFIVNFLTLFALFGAVFLFNIPILALDPLEPALYISLMILFLQLLFLCTVSMALSLTIKTETMSVLSSILLLFGFDIAATGLKPPYRYLSFTSGGGLLFDYFTGLFYGAVSRFTFQDVVLAFSFPVLTSVLLLVLSFIYFQWIMQID